jgi:hypothetical protein
MRRMRIPAFLQRCDLDGILGSKGYREIFLYPFLHAIIFPFFRHVFSQLDFFVGDFAILSSIFLHHAHPFWASGVRCRVSQLDREITQEMSCDEPAHFWCDFPLPGTF